MHANYTVRNPIIGVLLIQAKRIEAKERIQVGIGLVAIKKTVKP